MDLWTYFLLAAAALGIADLCLHAFAVRLVLPQFERKIPFGVEQTAPNPQAAPIQFPTTDGLTLRGSLWHPESESRGLIVFCPELGGNHWSAGVYGEALVRAGYTILAFDFRNQGDSDRLPGYDPLHWLTEHEVADVQSAIRYARTREDLSPLPIGLFGISRGGAAALVAATRTPGIQAIACEGSYSTESLLLHYTLRWASLYLPATLMRMLPLWHVRLTLGLARLASGWRRRCRFAGMERALSKLRALPVLMIAGSRDTYVAPQITERLCELVGSSHGPLQVFDGAKHNQSRQIDPVRYDGLLLDVFARLEASSVTIAPAARILSVA